MSSNLASTKAHCNVCNGERNHVTLHKVTESDLEDDYQTTETYETLRCAGCNSIKLRHIYQSDAYKSICYYPAAAFRRYPKWFSELALYFQTSAEADAVVDLLHEVYISLQHDMLRVAAMGVRALLETIMISKTGDCGSFSNNLDSFEKLGYVSQIQKERLSATLETGHATIHRNYNPSRDDVVTLVDIAEHLIETVYIHETKIKKLQNRIPKRPSKPNKPILEQ